MYHPAFDVNHCLYRITAILINTRGKQISWDLLRILDFYYLFPSQLKTISPWPSDIREYKSQVKDIPEQFEEISNKPRIFFDLLNFQSAAISELIAKGIILNENLSNECIKINIEAIPQGFIDTLKEDTFLNSNVFKVITTALPRTKFHGKNGLKQRSGLMEYIYDSN